MPLKVLIVHNTYLQRGGEDGVVDAEMHMLRQRGHDVIEYRVHNERLRTLAPGRAALGAIWSASAYRAVCDLVRSHRPDVMHVHNTFPLISPAVFWAAKGEGVTTVQTLHNFRLLCPQAMLLRAGRVCEDCVGALAWRGVLRRCYRGSAAQSAVVAATSALHRQIGTYARKVDRFIALNDFCRRKFIEGGLPAHKIEIKPNFVEVGNTPAQPARSGALYVGRLYPEKGIDLLGDALRKVPGLQLEVIGSGPEVAHLAQREHVTCRGWLAVEAVHEAMQRHAMLIVPSRWYENFPLVIVEAFANRLPVIAARLGALAEIVEDGVTGLLFEPGSAADLAGRLAWAMQHPIDMARMGQRARAVYEQRYSPEQNYRALLHIYDRARGSAGVLE